MTEKEMEDLLWENPEKLLNQEVRADGATWAKGCRPRLAVTKTARLAPIDGFVCNEDSRAKTSPRPSLQVEASPKKAAGQN
jgi:hypothetical protein